MGTGTPPLPLPPEQHGTTTTDQVRELLQFLREENSANRESVRVESESSRALLLHTLQIVAVPVTIALAIAGFFGWRSIDSFKESLQTELRSEAKRQTDAEISRMQEEVRQRINDQFQTPTIQKVVTQAAVQATTASANSLIKSQVEKEVKNRVAAEQGTIKKTVVEQTAVAVKTMTPEIESLVKTAVDAKVQNVVEPVARQVSGLSSEFYRIRQFAVKVDFVFPLDQKNAQESKVALCSLYFRKNGVPVAELGLLNKALTEIIEPAREEKSLSGTEDLYPPFQGLISKPIGILDGIDSLSLEFSFGPGAYDESKMFFHTIKEIRVQLSINSVPFDTIHVNGTELNFPKDVGSLPVVYGQPTFSIRHDLPSSMFHDTKKEYQRLTTTPSTGP